ncbi:MAG TPA: hypothetical protein VK208_12135 [Pyrinomonadaceae bacterium]|nr:hypothetical protein [Pyrinomonadaceae bacterium]
MASLINQKAKKIGILQVGTRLSFCLALLLFPSAVQAARCEQLKVNPNAWVAMRIDALVQTARRAFESDKNLASYEKVLDSIAETIHRCGFAADPGFMNRYRTFVEYVDAASLERQPNHELGFLVADEQYFAETRQFVGIPEFLLEPEFLRNVSRYETLGRAKSFLRRLNLNRSVADQLIFFSYKSRHLGTPDNNASYSRLLIVVPGKPQEKIPEKWVQFGVPDPGARTPVRNISVVAALANDDGALNAYFKDYYRSYKRDGSITVSGRWELGEGDDNCAQCHKSGILPIFPVQGSVSSAEQTALLAVNNRFRAYGSLGFGSYLDMRKLGPGLSSATEQDRDQRFGPSSQARPAARAMVCSSCHNAERLGALNWPMDKVLIKSFVIGGQMPLGRQLKPLERRELYAKLINEYFATDRDNPGILKSWLLGKSQ